MEESTQIYDILNDDDDESESKMEIDDDTLEICHIINSMYDCKNDEHLTTFYHASFGSPVKYIFVNAIQMGYLKGFPGLNSKSASKYINAENSTKKVTWTKNTRDYVQQ